MYPAIRRTVSHPRFGHAVKMFAAWLLLATATAHGMDLQQVKSEAYLHATLINSLQYSFEVEDSDGWKSAAEFYGDGTRYRVNRKDVQGLLIGGRRGDPLQFSSAFDDERYQLLSPQESSLRLQDGNTEANYSINTPQTYVYLWLQRPDVPFRWDSIRSRATWDKVLSDAKYLEHAEKDGVGLEVIEIPQRQGVRTPCIYQVSFAPSLGWLPIKYVRRNEQTGEASSTMIVDAYKTFQIEGRTVAVPTRLQYTESGADGVSLKQSVKLTVNESSLQVNKPVDETLFTLTAPDPSWIYDVDQQNRMLEAVQPPSPLPSDEPLEVAQAPKSWWPLIVGVHVVILACVFVAVVVFKVGRKKPGV